MSFITRRFGAFFLAAFLLSGPATAHSFKLGALEIGHPWARETPPSATTEPRRRPAPGWNPAP